MNHTPTPWAFRVESQTDAEAEKGEGLCTLFHQTPQGEQRITRKAQLLGEANAAFIVQACNAHAALVAAIEGLLDIDAAMTCPSTAAVNKAQAALKLATEEK